ncbi:hypothetical protein [Streptomyces sp. A1-5]|uniref:hypothetical protein n=1 Tax=Streptomyces sp. A1-5 TaxID=2738410 RepID=UPI001F160D02|nr:hypothetical protein [Streptomyces sp. A1-5]UJB41107.1 hypothetical protein HRD51_09980 [Streptomyces sp. A1-5]
MKLARRIIATGAAVAACAAAVVVTTSSSHASDSRTPVTVADGQPGYVVEDFNYPGADKIKEEKGIILKRGDGHITLADCSSDAGLLEVWSRKNDKVCFRTTGASGYLTLEIPSVFVIKGSTDHAADVTLTAPKTTPQEVEVSKGEWKSVGESTDPQGREHVLVEIRTSK